MKRKKTSIFLKSDIERFFREQRGQGIKESYTPWHKVKRGDPSSHGKSGRYDYRGRQIHVLSTIELQTFLFSTMLQGIYDIREQFPLALNPSLHEAHAYARGYGRFFPGSLDIAQKLELKHPKLRDGSQQPWVMTTDILITTMISGRLNFIAVACKSKKPLQGSRAWQLLYIEKRYWEERNIPWLLITPDLFDKAFADTLRSYRQFGLDQYVNPSLMHAMHEELLSGNPSYIDLCKSLRIKGYPKEEIERAFWSGYWAGDLPVEVRVRFQPLSPIRLIPKDIFLNLNPILAGRSAWDQE